MHSRNRQVNWQVFRLLLCLAVAAAHRVDHATPEAALTTAYGRAPGQPLALVFSDEFSEDGRRFDGGQDEYFFSAATAPDERAGGLSFYNGSKAYATTAGGALRLRAAPEAAAYWEQQRSKKGRVERWKPNVRVSKPYTAALLSSWNKLCFTGGVFEVKMKLPAAAEAAQHRVVTSAKLLGNLARVDRPASRAGVWPWSYDACNAEAGDVLADNPQRISACDPVPGPGLHPNQGRGAPEINLVEVDGTTANASLRYAPGIVADRPAVGVPPVADCLAQGGWYCGLVYGNGWAVNAADYGFKGSTGKKKKQWYADALGASTAVPESAFSQGAVFRAEWEPGPGGYLEWYVDGVLVYGVDGAGLREKTGGAVPSEPSYLAFDAAVFGNHGELLAAAETEIDYVRVWQREGSGHTMGCSPAGFPTEQYIETHAPLYADWEAPYDTAPLHPVPSWWAHLAVFLLVASAAAAACRLVPELADERMKVRAIHAVVGGAQVAIMLMATAAVGLWECPGCAHHARTPRSQRNLDQWGDRAAVTVFVGVFAATALLDTWGTRQRAVFEGRFALAGGLLSVAVGWLCSSGASLRLAFMGSGAAMGISLLSAARAGREELMQVPHLFLAGSLAALAADASGADEYGRLLGIFAASWAAAAAALRLAGHLHASGACLLMCCYAFYGGQPVFCDWAEDNEMAFGSYVLLWASLGGVANLAYWVGAGPLVAAKQGGRDGRWARL